MLKIYTVPISLYCAKLRVLLRHKSIQWREEPPPGGYGTVEYRRIVPSGNLPALVDGDLLISDSEAIAEYLNEKYPEPEMLPANIQARAKVRELSRFHDTRLEPALRALFAEIPVSKRNAGRLNSKAAALSARLEQLAVLQDGKARDLLLGDCGYAITFTWISLLQGPLQLGVVWPDTVGAYRQWLETCPAVAAELADYRPKLEAWLTQQ